MIKTIKKLLDSANLEDRKIAISLLESDNKVLEEFINKCCKKGRENYTTFKYYCRNRLSEYPELIYYAGKIYNYLIIKDTFYIDNKLACKKTMKGNPTIKLESL